MGSAVELASNTALLGKVHLEVIGSVMLHFMYQVCQLHRRGTLLRHAYWCGRGVHRQSGLLSTIFSATLPTMEGRLMSRYDSVSAGELPGFGTGTMVARRHWTGIVPAVRLWLKRRRGNRRHFVERCGGASLQTSSGPGPCCTVCYAALHAVPYD
ncbi:hypothetical protein TcBrA4_0095770 [Trypanosoma cruzi]|nr:hypothetical protein TcBrA4_0095770 [Trypanosoma cruzi]